MKIKQIQLKKITPKNIFQKILIIFLVTVASQCLVYAQSGMRYSEFATRLEKFFHPDLIADVTEAVGKSDFTVWGWDVGDFSDDGHTDLAFCIRRAGSRGRTMDVFIFVDIDGYLVKVGQLEYEFLELPLEVGVAFRHGILYVTQKFRQFNWKIESFKFVNGSLLNFDEYITTRSGRITNESYRNYYNLRNTEKYFVTATGRTEFWADYLTIPSYSRGRLIFKGITSDAFCNYIDYVPEGAYWWGGDSDLSFYVNSAYDNEYLYFTIFVVDDEVVKPYKYIANGEAIEVWLDVTDYDSTNNRFTTMRDENTTYRGASENIYKISILLGDFVNKEPLMSISSANGSNRKEMSSNIVADLTNNGYYAMFKIPFSAINRENFMVGENIIEWGCTVIVIDVDNEFRPEQRTVLQTSLFDENRPSSFGSLTFVPDGKWHGETYNIYRDRIMQILEEFGH